VLILEHSLAAICPPTLAITVNGPNLLLTLCPMVTPARTASTRSTRDKWGPSEWFGVSVFDVDDPTRLSIANDAKKPFKLANRECPFQTALTGKRKVCSKAGGICSMQQYTASAATGHITPTGIQVAICPHRIISKQVLNDIVPRVIGAGVQAVLVKEVPYSVSLVKSRSSGKPAAAGRIDWLLVDKTNPANFFAVETQSVYMSGKSQDNLFNSFIQSGGAIVMPPDHRQPDYKSSVPKRLAPQLASKAKHLSATSRKTVVIVDEFVYQNIHKLREVDVPDAFLTDPVRAEAHKLNGCEVIFAIVSIANSQLMVTRFLYCSIAAATDALNAVSAMSKVDFELVVKNIVAPVQYLGT
jgi:Restriction endonuclease NotI